VEGGGIEGVLGGEPESADGALPTGDADPVAVALALQAARNDAELSRTAGEYLAAQRALVRLQIKHFDEERKLAIAAAKRKRLSDRLRIAIQGFVVLVAVGALLGLAAMFWDARTDRGIRIEAFEVPPELADRGLTGEVVARKLLDRVTQMDRDSTTVRAASSFESNWGKDIKVEVPETGVSIGDISRWIHETFGHATRVGGEVYRTNAGLTVSVRVSHDPAIETSGTEEQLPALIQEAATRVYARTQPYRYGFWLTVQGQRDEADSVYRTLYAEGNRIDRIWALHGLANDQESPDKSTEIEKRVLAEDPHFMLAALNLASSEWDLGHEPLALSKYESAIADERGYEDRTLSSGGRELMLAMAKQDRDVLQGDYQAADQAATSELEDSVLPGNWRTQERMRRAAILIQLHDPSQAAGLLELVPAASIPRNQVRVGEIRSRLAAEHGDWPAALLEIQKPIATDRDAIANWLRMRDPGFLADVYAHTGRNTDADQLLASLAADNYDGWRARGRVGGLRGDYAGGDKAFAQAVQLAPSFAPAYNDWGNLLYAKGDLAGAIARYRDANRHARHWADPLKAWGDVLAKQGQTKQALAKYDEALKYAGNWAALRAARDALAKQKT
jgi:tetratricopeptide (TPR) repeat protein